MGVLEHGRKDGGLPARPEGSLCGCLVHVPAHRLAELMHYPVVDLVEWRLDSFIEVTSVKESLDLLPLFSTLTRHPVVATNRCRRQGGAFDGPEDVRVEVLQKAVAAGAEWVDIEADSEPGAMESLRSAGARIVLSHHDFSGTPEAPALRRMAGDMAQREVDVIKMIYYAKAPEDNLRVLDLIPFGRRELGVEIIAFCMGPYGGWSRFACLSLGSPWTYVQYPGLAPSAPGQYTADEMRRLLDEGRWIYREDQAGS